MQIKGKTQKKFNREDNPISQTRLQQQKYNTMNQRKAIQQQSGIQHQLGNMSGNNDVEYEKVKQYEKVNDDDWEEQEEQICANIGNSGGHGRVINNVGFGGKGDGGMTEFTGNGDDVRKRKYSGEKVATRARFHTDMETARRDQCQWMPSDSGSQGHSRVFRAEFSRRPVDAGGCRYGRGKGRNGCSKGTDGDSITYRGNYYKNEVKEDEDVVVETVTEI